MDRIEKLARTIAGLYNNSQITAPMAVLTGVAGPGKMTRERAYFLANAVIECDGYYFDYLDGRLIKTKVMTSGAHDFRLYDRDNGGPGAGSTAVEDGLTDPFYNLGG